MSKLEIGKKYLVSNKEWFCAPNGEMYQGVFGKLKSIASDKDLFGIEVKSNNVHLEIGNVSLCVKNIACIIQSDKCDADKTVTRSTSFKGKITPGQEAVSRIYIAKE